MKKLFIKCSDLLTVMLLLLACAFPAQAATTYDVSYFYQSDYQKTKSTYFWDASDHFSVTEKNSIISLLNRTSDEIGFNIAVYCGGTHLNDSRTEKLSQIGLKKLFDVTDPLGYSGTVFLYVDLDGKSSPYDYICSYHDAYLYYTDYAYGDRLTKIRKKMQSYFPKSGEKIVTSDIIRGLEEFCSQLISYKNAGPVNGACYEDDINGGYVSVQNGTIQHSAMRPYNHWYYGLLIGIAVAAIVVVIVSICVKKHYKFKSSTSASVYTSNNKVYMRNAQDIFIGSNVVRTKIESSSGSGGGGGGFGGGGGGGGGSGGHR